MDNQEILDRVEQGIKLLLENEEDSLKRGLNELNASTHLAFYLKPLFKDYNVDPEYNGDIDKPNDRKALDIASNRIKEIGKKPNELETYKLSPDIIVHRRRTNKHNLAVIEVKKDIHSKHLKDFDLIKLEHLTISYLGNHYNYNLGIAIVLGTNDNTGNYDLTIFKEGIPVKRRDLR
ncbi:MAG: hypothetical protein CML04_11775 [Pseudozobellia sp.]|nr:hypothetical protein [Pseudozobellia sp.]MBG50320.1 hypothetical protein [Pseudozobellia sp.]MBG50550.1 hypothetical protein [Pseudozobellia sp.]|tara:strand:+ start:1910 stop:2440 length:531 start_codon:yes stop_codon:yes gene_type:complete